MYGVRVVLRFVYGDIIHVHLEDFLQQLYGVLFAFVVAKDTDEYSILEAEILVLVHLACEEGVVTLSQGFVEEEVSGSAT